MHRIILAGSDNILVDSIFNVIDCGNDEEHFKEEIRNIKERENECESYHPLSNFSSLYEDIASLQTQYGREVNLSLVNMNIYFEKPDTTDDEKNIWDYLLEQKVLELTWDRNNQLEKVIQKNPNDYDIETYISKYENQTGKKVSEMQIQELKELNKIIQEGILLGKYNLQDYRNFLSAIPDLLSRKKVLAIGSICNGDFLNTSSDAIDKMPSAEEIAYYTTYSYIRRPVNFKIYDSANICKRMRPLSREELCIVPIDFKPSEIDEIKKTGFLKLIKGGLLRHLDCVAMDRNGIFYLANKDETRKLLFNIEKKHSAGEIGRGIAGVRPGYVEEALKALTGSEGSKEENYTKENQEGK